jgi:hypothetical protein
MVTSPIEVFNHAPPSPYLSYCSESNYRYFYVDVEADCNYNDVCRVEAGLREDSYEGRFVRNGL